ncbi:MAG: hypothetical protein QOI80_2513, partial [Solirubrobacteraceae bacterium]|nr:hypothetical protein [Solirubrobacteraceae bacterium]
MKKSLRRGALSALLALAVLPAAANAAFTPTVAVDTLAKGCGPKGVNVLPSSGGGLPAGVYKYKVEATVGGVDTAPCYEVTTGSAANNAAFLVTWESTPGATQYKIFRNDQLVKTVTNVAGTAFTTGPPPQGCPGSSATDSGPRCVAVDTALAVPGAAPNPLPAADTQAGGNPDLVITQTFDYGGASSTSSADDPAPNGTTANSASAKTNVLHFPSGLAANPAATAAVCKLSG